MQLPEAVVVISLFIPIFIIKTVTTTVFFHQNTSVVEVCAGSKYTLKCVTNTGTLVWRVGDLVKIFSNKLPVNQPSSLGDFIIVYPTNVSDSYITSVVNITRAPLALNGTVVQCRDGGNEDANSKEKILLVGTKLSAPRNLRFTALSFTSASIEWGVPSLCGGLIQIYVIQITDNSFSKTVYDTTSVATFVNVSGLQHGVEYSVTVFGRFGSTYGNRAVLLMSLDVTKNLSVASYSMITIFTSWQNPPSSYPPVLYYTVKHNVTVDGSFQRVATTQTNISIDGAQKGRVYYVQVTAVNVLGSGPTVGNSITLNPTEHNVCTCIVELGVSLPVCFILMITGCTLTAIIVLKRNTIVKLMYQKCKISLGADDHEDPSLMNPNIAYEKQTIGDTVNFYHYQDKVEIFANASYSYATEPLETI